MQRIRIETASDVGQFARYLAVTQALRGFKIRLTNSAGAISCCSMALGCGVGLDSIVA